MFSHVLHESLSESKVLHLAHWQAAAFLLPWAQQETLGWWAPSHAIAGLYLKDYIPLPASSNF